MRRAMARLYNGNRLKKRGFYYDYLEFLRFFEISRQKDRQVLPVNFSFWILIWIFS